MSVKVCSDSRLELEQRLGTETTEKTERTENSSHPGAGSEPQNTGRGGAQTPLLEIPKLYGISTKIVL